MSDHRYTQFGFFEGRRIDSNVNYGPGASSVLTGTHSLPPVQTRGKPQPGLTGDVPIPEEEGHDKNDFTEKNRRGEASSFSSWNHLFDIFITPETPCVAALTNHSPPRFVLVQRLSGQPKSETQLQRMALLKHENLMEQVTTFVVGKSRLVAWGYMPFSLLHLVSRRRDLDDLMTAPILRQILEGLCYLHKQGLEHGGLSCSNVLINHSGHVRIFGYENSKRLTEDRDREGLIRIMMGLVNGSYNETAKTFRYNDYNDYEETKERMPLTCTFLETLSVGGRDAKDMLKEKLFKLSGAEPLKAIISRVELFVARIKHEPARLKLIVEDE